MKNIITLFVLILHNLPSPVHALRPYFSEEDLYHKDPVRFALIKQLDQIWANITKHSAFHKKYSEPNDESWLPTIIDKIRPILHPDHPINFNPYQGEFLDEKGKYGLNWEELEAFVQKPVMGTNCKFMKAVIQDLHSIKSRDDFRPEERFDALIDKFNHKLELRQKYEEAIPENMRQLSDLIGCHDRKLYSCETDYLSLIEGEFNPLRGSADTTVKIVRALIHVLTTFNGSQYPQLQDIIDLLPKALTVQAGLNSWSLQWDILQLKKIEIELRLAHHDKNPHDEYLISSNICRWDELLCLHKSLKIWLEWRKELISSLEQKLIDFGPDIDFVLSLCHSMLNGEETDTEKYLILADKNKIAVAILEDLYHKNMHDNMNMNLN